MSEITTKAAKCPNCQKFHMIGSLESFQTDKSMQRDYAKYMRKGYGIVDVTTQEARSNFDTHGPNCP